MSLDPHALSEHVSRLGHAERKVLARWLQRRHVTEDPNAAFARGLSLGERAADRIASFGGSWTFVAAFLLTMAAWIVWNRLAQKPVDPFPFILLNLALSCVAALQAPVIMMSQNRQAAKDRLDAQHDYEVNLKAEMEITALHLKLDELREQQWQRLLDLQARQIALLEELVGRTR